jgi:hypothetical protein
MDDAFLGLIGPFSILIDGHCFCEQRNKLHFRNEWELPKQGFGLFGFLSRSRKFYGGPQAMFQS